MMAKFTDEAATAFAESFTDKDKQSIYEQYKSTLKKDTDVCDDSGIVIYSYSIWISPEHLFCVYSSDKELNEQELKEKFDKEYLEIRDALGQIKQAKGRQDGY